MEKSFFAQQFLVTERDILKKLLSAVNGEIHAAVAELAAELVNNKRLLRSRKIHFIDEDKAGHPIFSQQLPERSGVALHSVGTADNEHRVIEHSESALGLG